MNSEPSLRACPDAASGIMSEEQMKVHGKRLSLVITGLTVISMCLGTWATAAASAAESHSSAHKTTHTHAAARTGKACKKPTPRGNVIYSDIQFPGTLNLWQDNS